MMGKPRQFAVMLDESKDVFGPGDCVKGHVVVELAEDMKMKGLWLLFLGGSHVEWFSDLPFAASETYFRHEVPLFGKEPGQTGDAVHVNVLPAGRHVFPFQYQLPTGLPSSFEGKYGCIRYIIKATINGPRKNDKMPTTKTSFTVLDKTNEDSHLPQPHDLFRASTTKGRLSGLVELQVQPDRSIYCPGEVMFIRGNLNNGSGKKDVTSVEAKLVQIATFHGKPQTFSETIQTKNIVRLVRISGCKRGQSLTFSPSNGAVLRVPRLPPSPLRFCKIIDLEYRLDVVVNFEGILSSDLKTRIPIKISPYRRQPHDSSPPPWGTPCADPPTHPAAPPPYTPGHAVVNQPTSQVPSAPDINFPPFAPPSYAESMLGATSIRDTDDTDYTVGDLKFAPK